MNDNNDDLQNAINGIVNGAASGADAASVDAGAGVPDLGTAPVPPMSGDAAPDMQLPQAPVADAAPVADVDPAAGLMNAAPESIEEQAAPANEPVAPEPVEAPAHSGAISEVKKNMIQDLIPLMDKIDLTPEKKFSFYQEIIDAEGDSNLVPDAYAAAKGIADDAARAEALLYLIDKAE